MAPLGVAAITGSNQVKLNWLLPFQYGIGGYNIYRSLTGTLSDFTNIGFTTSNFYVDNLLNSNVKYYYYIRSVNLKNQEGLMSTIIPVKTLNASDTTRQLSYGDRIQLTLSQTDFNNINEFSVMNWQLLRYVGKYFDEEYSEKINMVKSSNQKLGSTGNVKTVENYDSDSSVNIFWVLFKNAAGNEIHNMTNDITLKIKLPDTYSIKVDTSLLKMFVVDETKQQWTQLANSFIDESGYLNVVRRANSFYTFLQTDTPVNNLSNFIVYPNPFYKSKTISGFVTFANIPADFQQLHIYNINGELVASFNPNQAISAGNNISVQWDIRNSYGREIASGIYIYVVKTAGDRFTGKLGIIK